MNDVRQNAAPGIARDREVTFSLLKPTARRACAWSPRAEMSAAGYGIIDATHI